MSLNVKVKGQGHRGQFFHPFGGLRAVYVWYNIFSLFLALASNTTFVFQKYNF